MKRLTILLMLLLAASTTAPQADPRGDYDPHNAPTPFRPLATSEDIAFAAKVANGNLVGVTITNYGFIGNNFISRDPSFEYPLGGGYEHLVRGGLWIGGIATTDEDGTFAGVVTGALDGSQAASAQGATEFTPTGRAITARSSLITSDVFDKKAISELDLISDFGDRPAKRSDNNGEDHRPMNLLIHQENYAWSFSDFTHVNFFHFTIVNDGRTFLNGWVGLYAEFASGNKKAQSQWPPSGWYNKKWIACDDTLTMKSADSVRAIPPLFREHYCQSVPVPAQCRLDIAPYWTGIKLLGWKRSKADTTINKKVTLAAWRWAPGSGIRNEDTERYNIMSAGTIQSLQGDSLQPSSGDPVELLAVGPFSKIDPGDTISVDFALVGGAEIRDIQEHARFAQRAFDRNYIVPVPPPPPRLRVVSRHNAVDLFWSAAPETAVDVTSPLPIDFEGYRVYIGEDRLDQHLVAQFDKFDAPHDTTGYNTGLPVHLDVMFPGDTTHYNYKYTIDHLRDGFKYYISVTSFDIGNTEIESLESGLIFNKTLAIPAPAPGETGGNSDKVTVFPNPYKVEARWDQGQKVRDHYLWFANMPERARIKIFTLAGDLVYDFEFDGGTYHGTNARGVYNPRTDIDIRTPQLSGRTFAWDLITNGGQAAATGLYLFAIEDKASGDIQRGKFLIVKSDREDF